MLRAQETDQKAGTVAYLRLVTDSLTDLVLVADMWVRMCASGGQSCSNA